MSFTFSGKTAVVTGASQGIGAAVAQRLAELGCVVVLIGRDASRLEVIASDLRASGKSAQVFPCDLSKPDQVIQTCEAILEAHSCVDILINNAGVGKFGPFLDMSIEEVLAPMQVPTIAAVLATRFFAPAMVDQGFGRIINIGVPAAYFSLPWMVPYTISRTALLDFSRSLNQELEHKGVIVGSVCPAWVETDYLQNNSADEGWLPKLSVMFPRSSPQQVAEFVTNAIRKGKREYVPSLRLRFFIFLYRHFPDLSIAILKMLRVYQPATRLLDQYECRS